MNIILACDGITQGRGGAERVVAWLANGLSRHGHRVSLFTVDPLGREPVYPLEPAVSLAYYDGGEAPESIRALQSRIAEIQAELCIVFCWHKALMPWVVALGGMGIPLVASEHASPEFVEQHSWNREDRLTAFSGADLIHLLSARFAESLPDSYAPRIRLIPNPIALPRQAGYVGGSGRSGQRTLLSVGGLHYNKQRAMLIEAVARLRPRFPEWRLDIWGEGPEKTTLIGLIARLNAGDYVALRGETDRIDECYANADLFCMPSRHESFGLALGEALGHGLPAVGFAACTGVNELIQSGTNGLLASDMNVECLAETLSVLMADDVLRERLGRQAPATVARFAEDSVLGAWLQLVGEVAALPAGRESIPQCMPYSYLLERCRSGNTARTYNSMTAELEGVYASRSWKLACLLRRLKLSLSTRRPG